MEQNRQIELILAKQLLEIPFHRKIKTQESHPLGVRCVHRYPQRLHARRIPFAIYTAARDVNHLVALRAQLAQHLHPLHVCPVAIRMRQHFMDHQNIQRPLACAAIAVFF